MSSSEVKLYPEKTWIQLSVFIATLLACLSGAVWGAINFTEFKNSIDDLQSSVNRVENRVDMMFRDGMSRRDFQQWVEVLQAKNPTLQVPEPR